jgi:hypothetical protein
LGSINNINFRMLRGAAFDRWWIEWKKHLFHQPASMYLTNLFPKAVPQVRIISFVNFVNCKPMYQF